MKTVFFFKTVEIKPLQGSALLVENSNIYGAFVSCIAAGENKEDALVKLKNALKKDFYDFISVEEMHNFSEAEWINEDDEIYFKSLAWDAITNDLVGYGVFNCY